MKKIRCGRIHDVVDEDVAANSSSGSGISYPERPLNLKGVPRRKDHTSDFKKTMNGRSVKEGRVRITNKEI